MKDYLNRLKKGCSPACALLWWLIRLFLTAMLIGSFFKSSINITTVIHIGFCLVLSFLWELCMLFDEKHFMSFMPASLQTVINISLLVSASGRFFSLYATLSWWDPLLQFFFGGFCVYIGYEVAYAIIRRDRYCATKAMAFYVAFGIGFLLINSREVFEFTCDQLIGAVTGTPGDAQFWSLSEATGTAREIAFLNQRVPERYGLMDTASDILLSTISAFIALLMLNLYPYRIKGKHKLCLDFENAEDKAVKKQ